MNRQEQQWMLPREMADLLRTSRKTVLRAAASGRIESVRLGPQTIRVRLPKRFRAGVGGNNLVNAAGGYLNPFG